MNPLKLIPFRKWYHFGTYYVHVHVLPEGVLTKCFCTYQGTKNKEDHEESAKDSFTIDVTKSYGGHGDQHEVDTLPVGQRLSVGKVKERIT